MTIVIIFNLRKLRLRKIKGLSPSHTASRQRRRGSVFVPCCFSSHLSTLHRCLLLWLLHAPWQEAPSPSGHLSCAIIDLLISVSHWTGSSLRAGTCFIYPCTPASTSVPGPEPIRNDFCWLCCTGFFFDSCWLMLLKSHIPSTQTHLSCDISTYFWVCNGVMCILWYQLKQLFFFQILVCIKSF